MKRFVSLLLLVCIVASFCTVSAFADSGDLPTATVTDISNDPANELGLTYALRYVADPLDDETLEKYEDWGARFEISINKDVQYGEIYDGWIAGAYGIWGWLKFHDWGPDLDGQWFEGGESYPIIELPFGAVYGGVVDFCCGIKLNENFLALNPDHEVTIMLKLISPEGEEYEVDRHVFPARDPAPGGNDGGNGGGAQPQPKPAASNPYSVPATADNSNVALWSMLFVAFAVVAVITAKKRKA